MRNTHNAKAKRGDKVNKTADAVRNKESTGIRALKGVLASKKGKGMSFAAIREAAARLARRRRTLD